LQPECERSAKESRKPLDLRDYIRISRRRWKLIGGCMLAAIAMAMLLTARATPQYSSQARMFVSTATSNSNDAYTGSLLSFDKVTSYASVVGGEALSSRVVDRLGLDMSPGELAGKVSASVVPETVIIKITATDPDPRTAQRLAQGVAEGLTKFVAELETPPGKAHAPVKATIFDAAQLPLSPISPRPVRNLALAVILGLLLGLGIAVLRELFDTSVKTDGEISDITGAPVMADIAFDSSAAKRPLVTQLDSHAPRAEAFRVLRTNMQFVDVDGGTKCFVVTSSVPEEGKTTTVTNLAITMAQAGQRVVLVEGDLRRPKIAENLGLEPAVGLTTVLVGRLGLREAIQAHRIPNLSVLTSGAIPPNPSELLQSQAMALVLNQLRTDFDVVLVDAPPLLPVTDAAIIAAQSDGALLVVRHGKTTRDQVRHCVERLTSVDAKAVGVVFNMIPNRRSHDAYYGYGYGYGYAPENRRPDSATEDRDPGRSTETTSLEELGFK
jgi:capsular exopolysaccharide synthesis family protein